MSCISINSSIPLSGSGIITKCGSVSVDFTSETAPGFIVNTNSVDVLQLTSSSVQYSDIDDFLNTNQTKIVDDFYNFITLQDTSANLLLADFNKSISPNSAIGISCVSSHILTAFSELLTDFTTITNDDGSLQSFYNLGSGDNLTIYITFPITIGSYTNKLGYTFIVSSSA